MLAIRDEWARALALAGLAERLEGAPDRERFLARLREGIAHLLLDSRRGRRDTLLRILGQEGLFRPPIVSTETLAAIARHIIEICSEWRWA